MSTLPSLARPHLSRNALQSYPNTPGRICVWFRALPFGENSGTLPTYPFSIVIQEIKFFSLCFPTKELPFFPLCVMPWACSYGKCHRSKVVYEKESYCTAQNAMARQQTLCTTYLACFRNQSPPLPLFIQNDSLCLKRFLVFCGKRQTMCTHLFQESPGVMQRLRVYKSGTLRRFREQPWETETWAYKQQSRTNPPAIQIGHGRECQILQRKGASARSPSLCGTWEEWNYT